MESKLKPGREVKRNGSASRATTGRVGVIIAINLRTQKARVHWKWTSITKRFPINIRTWVPLKELTPITHNGCGFEQFTKCQKAMHDNPELGIKAQFTVATVHNNGIAIIEEQPSTQLDLNTIDAMQALITAFERDHVFIIR